MGARQSWRRKYPRPEADAREQHETKKWRTVVRHSFDDQWAKLTTVPACTSRAAVSSLVASFIGLAIDAIPLAGAEVQRLVLVTVINAVVVARLISPLLVAVVVLPEVAPLCVRLDWQHHHGCGSNRQRKHESLEIFQHGSPLYSSEALSVDCFYC